MDKFKFDHTMVSNLMHDVSPEIKKMMATWFTISLLICYSKPNWSILKTDQDTFSFGRIIFTSFLISMIPFLWPHFQKLPNMSI